MYVPFYFTETKIRNEKYFRQSNISNKGYEWSYLNEFDHCKICSSFLRNSNRNICVSCGKILCDKDTLIDDYDHVTLVCPIDKIDLKLFFDIRYFGSKDNQLSYKKWWNSLSFIKKIFEDKITFNIFLVLSTFLIISLIMIFS